MGAVRRRVLLALLIVPCLAELNSTESEGKSSCQASVGGSSQSDAHRALILQLNPNEDCTWTLERPENKSIRLIFSHFQLDPDGGCESEHIQVFEGNSTKGSLLGKFCSKHDYIPVFQSSSNTLTIQIVTDSVRIQRTVFIFYYFFSPGTSPRFHCNAKQNAKKFCKWIPEQSSTLVCFLRPRADHVTLLLNHTNLQSGTVQVLQSQTQATFSGLTSGHYLTAIPDCGGYLDSLEGSFTSPNYPNPHPELAYCVWHIQVEKGYKIKLNFKDIFLETDEHCRFDFIAVYDGSSTTSGLIGQVCGYAKPTFESSSDSLTVVLSTDYANSYRGFSASYTSIYAENINTTSLICSSDRMRAIISKSYLASFKYNENNLQLNDPTCRPKISNVVEFSIPLDGCGTIKKVEDYSVTYTNIIILIPSPTSEVITRQKHLQIILKCEMESNSTVEMMYITEDDVIQNQSGVGKYNTSMALFESNSFEKPILESPYYVDLNQTLFVQVSLRTSDPNLVVFLDTCIASPTPDFASPTYDLIKSGCNQDETCKVYPLSGHYGRFQFDAFKFLRSLGSVYLQCKILICDSSDQQSRCNQGCVSRRKRDISSYKWKTDSVIGPIRLKKDRSASGNPGFQDQIHREETQNQPFDSLHLFSFMALALNVVIVAALIARRFVNQRADYKYQKLQNIN